jgi:hypothetical protein
MWQVIVSKHRPFIHEQINIITKTTKLIPVPYTFNISAPISVYRQDGLVLEQPTSE